MIDYIYALVDSSTGCKFYIGRTENPTRRISEHRYGARVYKSGDELKYQYANALDSMGIEWHMEILMECGPDTDHYEDYFVNKYRYEPLQNMKAGDSEPWMGRDYSSPEEFLHAREKHLTRKKIVKVKREYKSDVERTLIVGENINDRFMSPAIRAMKERRNGNKR